MDRSADQLDRRDTTPASPSPGCVVFQRWVTLEDAELDLHRLARLN
jgi:hypothetical protein